MHNTKLLLSYDGTDFFGWQRQKDVRTVQQVLEEALQKLNGGVHLPCTACSRTDAGVHAIGQAVNFHSNIQIPFDKLVYALNGNLPRDVVVRAAELVADDFDASRSARKKMYRYVIHNDRIPDVFHRRYCWEYPICKLDEQAMNRAAECLLGKHDFRCFETEWPNRKTSVRTIAHLLIERIGNRLHLEIEADGFLYNMVRSIMGTLVNVGRGYWPIEQVNQILDSGDRTQAGPTAPPQGLFLVHITY